MMRTRTQHLGSASTLSFCVCLASTIVAQAQPAADSGTTNAPTTGETPAGASATAAAEANVEQARLHFRRGIDSYRDGDLATALIEFKRAYSTAPNYRLLYNLGQVCTELRDYPAAERYLTRYLEQAGDTLDDARRQAVEGELKKVRTRIAFLHLSSNVDGTELFVDDVPVGRTPLIEPVHVSTGRRRVTGRAPGHTPVTQVVDTAGAEDVSVNLNLQPIPSPRSDEPVAIAAKPHPAGTRKPLLIGLAIGAGVLAAGGGVFGYLAQSSAADYRSALERKTTAAELKDLSKTARTNALVTDFLLGAAMLTATVGAVVLLSPDSDAHEHAALRVGIGRVELTQSF